MNPRGSSDAPGGSERGGAGRRLPCQRAAFSLPEHVHYLNCAYLAPLPRAVEEAGLEALRRRRAPLTYSPESFFTEADRVRALFARLLGAPDPARVAIVPSVSYGISTAARNVQAESGQSVVLLEEQFPSNVYPWRRLAVDRDLAIHTVPRPPGGPGGESWTERLLQAIRSETAVVAVPQVHWTDGAWLDLVAVGARAREVGAALVVDASQSVGALPFDLQAVQPDAVVCAGYKWLLGPYGLGLAYYGARFDRGIPLEETWIAREGSEDFQGLVRYTDAYQPGAARFDVGERSSFFLLPMLGAALELVLEWGPGAIQEYCGGLTGELLERLTEGELGSVAEGRRAGHILGLRLPAGVELPALQARLEGRHIHASLRGDALRISPHVYNGSEDVQALAEVLLHAL